MHVWDPWESLPTPCLPYQLPSNPGDPQPLYALTGIGHYSFPHWLKGMPFGLVEYLGLSGP
jgi:hypothetical protein